MSVKSDRFRRLAEKRAENALRYINLVGNLANRSNYEYTEEEQRKIITALQDAVRDVASKFRSKSNGERNKFKF